VTVSDGADGLYAYPPADRAGQLHEVPPPCSQEVVGVLEPAGEREQEHPDQPGDRVQGQEPREREQPVVLEHRREP
jgi:hypothetical protein